MLAGKILADVSDATRDVADGLGRRPVWIEDLVRRHGSQPFAVSPAR